MLSFSLQGYFFLLQGGIYTFAYHILTEPVFTFHLFVEMFQLLPYEVVVPNISPYVDPTSSIGTFAYGEKVFLVPPKPLLWVLGMFLPLADTTPQPWALDYSYTRMTRANLI